MQREGFKCALVREVYLKSQRVELELLLSTGADMFPLLSKREICLSYDRRGLLLPFRAHSCHEHESIRLAEWCVCLQAFVSTRARTS